MNRNHNAAIHEAGRCLSCKNPKCVAACPAGVNIPKYIRELLSGDMRKAYATLSEENFFPSICGRTCAQSNQCEGACVLGIKGEPVGIGQIETFLGDMFLGDVPAKTGELTDAKVAVVGSGPGGLSCARRLAEAGVEVTIYEADSLVGGVPMQSIPSFRLPKSVVHAEVNKVRSMGVNIISKCTVGKDISIDKIISENDFVFVATGLTKPMELGIEGEGFSGVVSSRDFLRECVALEADGRQSAFSTLEHIVVLGGGNVAMDAARYAKKLGCDKVTLVYRRSFEEMPAWKTEIEHAKAEGVNFILQSNPSKISRESGVGLIVECMEMELGEPDRSGRRRPTPIGGSEFYLICDRVIVAIGENPDGVTLNGMPRIRTDRKGCIVLENENGLTSDPKTYAGGDIAYGAASVVLAMNAGKKAAEEIIFKLKAEKNRKSAT